VDSFGTKLRLITVLSIELFYQDSIVICVTLSQVTLVGKMLKGIYSCRVGLTVLFDIDSSRFATLGKLTLTHDSYFEQPLYLELFCRCYLFIFSVLTNFSWRR